MLGFTFSGFAARANKLFTCMRHINTIPKGFAGALDTKLKKKREGCAGEKLFTSGEIATPVEAELPRRVRYLFKMSCGFLKFSDCFVVGAVVCVWILML